MTTYFIQMFSGHKQEIEGVKDICKIDGNHVFYDENDLPITVVPVNNMAFYTTKKESITKESGMRFLK